MDRARPRTDIQTGEVVDFDEALLASLPAELREELRAEAIMLADAFAPKGRAHELEAMADALTRGEARSAEPQMDRRRARGLAAALRAIARSSEG
ncbi:hypothetical protein [Phenylobacterium soli]|uniref:Uncharacterized protein n=1 Tax=Phenylobacterium soli TaxID=2170551 RepID=A0A328AN79_9CAUL|nr:hypothetical protein [Phenylobacterium soli]RAK55821.1 hypothetical protein DJ017_15535 [Phenylobacterium soli]